MDCGTNLNLHPHRFSEAATCSRYSCYCGTGYPSRGPNVLLPHRASTNCSGRFVGSGASRDNFTAQQLSLITKLLHGELVAVRTTRVSGIGVPGQEPFSFAGTRARTFY
eukprot:1839840-Rhodomonas_salina.2